MAEYECNGCGDEIKECSCTSNNNIGIDFDAINRLVEEIKNSSKELPPLKIETFMGTDYEGISSIMDEAIERNNCEVALPQEEINILRDGDEEEKNLIDFSPWKNESSGIKESSLESEIDDGEDGCFIDYSNLYDISLKERVNTFKEELEFKKETEKIRKFETGATRDSNENKLEYARFNSPIVMKRFAEYMNLHRKQSDGNLREGDNWQNLFGDKHEDVCMDSLLRHVMDVWLINKGFKNEAREDLESALCAIMFNVNAWLFKILLDKRKEKNV